MPLEKALSAAFDAHGAAPPTKGFFEARLLMLMIHPPPRSRRWGMTARHGIKHPADIRLDGRLPLSTDMSAAFLEYADPRIVDEDVDGAETTDELSHGALDVVRLSHVGSHRQRAAPSSASARDKSSTFRPVIATCTTLDERPGYGASDAARTARHQRDFTREFTVTGWSARIHLSRIVDSDGLHRDSGRRIDRRRSRAQACRPRRVRDVRLIDPRGASPRHRARHSAVIPDRRFHYPSVRSQRHRGGGRRRCDRGCRRPETPSRRWRS